MKLGRLLILLVLLAAVGAGSYFAVQRYEENKALQPPKDLASTNYQGEIDASAQSNDGPRASYPGGVSVSLVSIDRLPNKYHCNCGALSPGQTIVRVHVVLNSFVGSVPLKTGHGMFDVTMQLWYGPNRQQAELELGANDAADVVAKYLPEILAPNTNVEFYESFDVPTSQLGNLIVGADPFADPNYKGIKFSHAEAVLR